MTAEQIPLPKNHWKNIGKVFSVIVLFFFPAFGSENSCVDCHSRIAKGTIIGHDFDDWKNSVHGRNNVTCHECHGGHPQAEDMEASHQGILPSNNTKSPLYFTHIPESCGNCHIKTLKEFKKSFHYAELKRTGRGPNCLTCHGSMATWILRSDQIQQTCSLCHTKPTQAQAALVTLNFANSIVDKLAASIPAEKKERKKYENLVEKMEAIKRSWHSFNMEEIMSQSRKIIKKAREISTNWKLKSEK